MKIIQVSSYYPPHLGGGDNVVRAISENLALRGHTVEVLTSDIGSKNGKLPLVNNLKVNYLKSAEFAHASIIYSLFFKLIQKKNTSILHVHVGHGYVPEMVYVSSYINKLPYIAHFHLETIPTGRFGFILPFYKKNILKKVLKRAQCVIVPTSDYKTLVHNNYDIPLDRIVIIPNGLNISNFIAKKKSVSKKVKILFVGRLSKQKNIPLLINAFNQLTKEYNNLELHIVGEGEERKNLREIIDELHLKNKVIMHGLLRDKELAEIYTSSDIFVLPSTYESFGLVLIEAMASGTPVIASDILALRNVVRNKYNGLLFKLNEKELVNAIKNVIEDKKLREEIAANALKDIKNYDWKVIAKQIEELYSKLLKGQEKSL